MLFKKFLFQVIGVLLGLWSAGALLPKVEFQGTWQDLLLASIVLALANLFLKPFLGFITFPLKILTLGFFPFILNMALIWGLDIIFPEIIIKGIFPLLLTTLLVWFMTTLAAHASKKRLIRPKERAGVKE